MEAWKRTSPRFYSLAGDDPHHAPDLTKSVNAECNAERGKAKQLAALCPPSAWSGNLDFTDSGAHLLLRSATAYCTSTLPVLRADQNQTSTPLAWIQEMYASAVRDRRLHRNVVDGLGPDDPGGLIRS